MRARTRKHALHWAGKRPPFRDGAKFPGVRGTRPAKGEAPMKTINAHGKPAALNARFELFLTLFVRTPAPRRNRARRRS